MRRTKKGTKKKGNQKTHEREREERERETYKSAPYFRSRSARPQFPVMNAKCKAVQPNKFRNIPFFNIGFKFHHFEIGPDVIIFAAMCINDPKVL